MTSLRNIFDENDFFLSGTPKGIVHCHQNISNFSLSSTDGCKRMLITNVGFHVGGFLIPLRSGILNNKVVYFVKEKCFTAQHCLDMVAKGRHKSRISRKMSHCQALCWIYIRQLAFFEKGMNLIPLRTTQSLIPHGSEGVEFPPLILLKICKWNTLQAHKLY